MEEHEVLDAARAIRPHLPDLVGDEANDVDRELQRLLARAETGENVKTDVLELLRQRDKTRQWANALLKVPPQYRSYERQAGRVQRVSVPKYSCPQGYYVWYRFSIGDQVPLCPNDGSSLVEASS
jgi:hypothetical protein